ncbi:magnesium/cobalt transporter CorA [Paenibacillus sp. P96]|uniref:Magnesium transport protein CorA n=1 Tax=Paenibacillus zeirhizosphaerae TaxID=2987519 RepID=A0ABT9FMK8_9BACL|nr:magnesium/cobalt transporter CorA [Paenibacillus sp. P96]MDP4095771.1 magnesium/cobalt transporter CorA [Paenibacillus sp. P96]
MIRTLAIGKDHQLQLDIPLTDLRLDEYEWIWADFSEPTEEEAALLEIYFHFHPLAVEDCLYVLQRPKLDYYEDVQFLVLHALDPDRLTVEEVDLFMSRRFLVSYHKTRLEEIDQAWERIVQYAREGRIWARGTLGAAYTVMDKLVDRYFPCLFKIEDELAELENRSRSESVEELMNQVFELRSRLLKLRRTIVPMRDLMYRVVNSEHIQGQGEHKAYFTDIYDHLLKLSDMIDADREMTADLRDSYISLNSNRMNTIMKTLTVITTIFMPLTLIAGIYGMNFSFMPELGWKHGYFAVLVLMILLGSGMIYWFSRRGWFK